MKKLIIVGGGYAGIRAMKRLKGVENLEIQLIDIQPYQYLQTEAYSLIANTSMITHVTVDLPSLCEYNENAFFLRAKVTDINFDERYIICDTKTIAYDYLIISTGNYTHFPKQVEGLKEHSIGIKSLKNAFYIRQSFARQMYALMSRDIKNDDNYFNVVIGGAGLSGVEIAAEMSSKANEFVKYNHIADYKLNIYLISSGENVLPGMHPYLQNKSLARLKKMGVNVLLNTRIQSAQKHKVFLSDGTSIDHSFMIFTGGVTTSYFIKELNNCELSAKGQIIVEKTMQIKNHKRVYAIGDVAQLINKHGEQIASTAHGAEQSAEIAAKNIKLDLQGKEQIESSVNLEGVLVALGHRNAAVVLFNKYKFSGFLGYMLKTFITWQYKHELDNDAKVIHKKR